MNSVEVKMIDATVRLGDAGTPVDITVEVWYNETPNGIVVTHSEYIGGPENTPNWWPEKIKQIIEESFENQKVILL